MTAMGRRLLFQPVDRGSAIEGKADIIGPKTDAPGIGSAGVETETPL